MLAVQPHPGFWRTLLLTFARNPISTFAVLCVAATAGFLGFIVYRMLKVLESTNYCSSSIQAERISPGSTFAGLTGCIDILKIQLEALATGFHIGLGSFAFSLIVLIVVVVAGARASGKIAGMEFDMSRQDAPAAAQAVADTAQDTADIIKEQS